MRILIAVKEVAEVRDEFETDGLKIDDHYLEYDLNEWDDYAIEEAVQLSEAYDDIEVVSATIGPERAEETIRKALAKGVDRAIRIWDDDIAAAPLLDISTKSDIFASVIEEEDPDLVLTGVQADDDGNGATGVSLASRVGYEWAAVVTALDLDLAAEIAHVHRELEGGVEELTDVEIPAVLTIQTGINEPRYASLRGIRQAQRKPLDHRTLNDLGLSADVLDTPIERTALYEPEAESEAIIWEGDPDETAANLVDLLQEREVITG
jgi:electron transfer flavoprotein beta subunit